MRALTVLLLTACTGATEAPADPATDGASTSEKAAGDVAAGDTPSDDVTPSKATSDGAASASEAPSVKKGAIVAGPFTITPAYHATTRIDVGGTTIWLDPWSKADLSTAPKADVVLLTDIHQDHLDPAGLDAVATDATVFVAPEAVQARLGDARSVQHVLHNGDAVTVAGVQITAVPMYNLERGPKPGTLFHEKGRGNGYILEKDGTRVYFAGDTACTDAMKALRDIDVAFLPMNLPYTMPPDEAAACVAAFKPALAVPYHYAGPEPTDRQDFARALQATEGVSVAMVEYYPGGTPF